MAILWSCGLPGSLRISTLSSRQISRWSEHGELSTFQVSWDGIFYFQVVLMGLVRHSGCSISATLRGRWHTSASTAGAFPSAPRSSFWPSTFALRRQLRGSWLAGGFQWAVKFRPTTRRGVNRDKPELKKSSRVQVESPVLCAPPPPPNNPKTGRRLTKAPAGINPTTGQAAFTF